MEHGKVHKQPAILFVPEEESTAKLDKVKITLWIALNVSGGDAKNNITKKRIMKINMGSPEELINWRIRLNHVIKNKLCKISERQLIWWKCCLGARCCNIGNNLSIRKQ
eukprot:10842852-Ditylum_brightwellii.AAC.1